jgi:hypothetical protein
MGNQPTTTASNQCPFAGTVLEGAKFEPKELAFIQIHTSGIQASLRPIMQFARESREKLLEACFTTNDDNEEVVCPNLAIYYADDGENRGIAIFCGEKMAMRSIAPHKLVSDVIADQLQQDQFVAVFSNALALEHAQSMSDYA